MFEWVLSTPLKTFGFITVFSETLLVEVTFAFRAVCLQLLHLLPRKTFIWDVIKTSILFKPLKFF